jgi:hypothetical protein
MQIHDELLDIEGIKKSNKPLLDLFIRRTAVLTSTPEHLVDKIVRDQWKRANRASQSSSEVSEIDFCNLGSFFMSKSKANKRIKKMEDMKRVVEANGPNPDPKIQKKLEATQITNMQTINLIKFKTKQTNEN